MGRGRGSFAGPWLDLLIQQMFPELLPRARPRDRGGPAFLDLAISWAETRAAVSPGESTEERGWGLPRTYTGRGVGGCPKVDMERWSF